MFDFIICLLLHSNFFTPSLEYSKEYAVSVGARQPIKAGFWWPKRPLVSANCERFHVTVRVSSRTKRECEEILIAVHEQGFVL